MPKQAVLNGEKLIPLTKARRIIISAAVVYLVVGLVIGYLFVWYPYQNKSRYDAGIKDALKLVQLKPNDINARINLGFNYMKAKKYDQAKGEYNAALQIDPNNITAKMNMAYLDIEMTNYNESDKILSDLNKSEPGFQSFFLLGKSKYLQGKYNDAIQNLLSARDSNPTDTETVYYLGLSYERIGQKDNAIKTFKGALDFDPNRNDVKNELKKLGVK